jgi:hypothetical protein
MQYSFAYMYFMMQELKPFDLGEFWALMDTNQDGYAVGARRGEGWGNGD